MSGVLVAEKLRLLLPLVLDEVINWLKKSLLLRPISRTTYFTPRSARLCRLARSLQRLRDLVHNSAYTKKDESTLTSEDSEWMKRDARSLVNIRSKRLCMAIKHGSTSQRAVSYYAASPSYWILCWSSWPWIEGRPLIDLESRIEST